MTPIVTMSRQLPWLILSGSVLLQLSIAGPVDPTITPPAELFPRDKNDLDFMGYTRSGTVGPYKPLSCESGLTFTEDAYIYENIGDQGRQTLFFCDSSAAKYTLYRNMPPVTTTDNIDTFSTSTSPTISTTTPAAATQTAEPKSSSKAWIAGVVVGPLLGLALVAAGVLLCLRRKKKKNAQAPHHGVATMAPVNPSQPPTGVTGYTDAKPQFQPAQGTYYNSQQEQAYPQQGAFSPPQVSPPVSPAPQYAYQAPYNTSSSPSNAPYTQDVKHAAHGGAAELGGSNVIAPAVSVPQGAELGGQNEKKTGR
ncbi:hypothetical protein E8E13_003992 [Curvularia kusanoi]|uniref:Uncharacterized protein n=1 Tax=Curvularia kusanoi TaxID=90978 RepID=A0A9P4T6R1_CURKU|nr:hypothetical protein E8E13_003992 [Curvularia kusanoi]